MAADIGTRYSRHPGLDLVLRKLHRGEPATDSEYALLIRMTGAPGRATPPDAGAAVSYDAVSRPDTEADTSDRLPGHATRIGTDRLLSRLGRPVAGFHRPAQDMLLPGIGIGTYRGSDTPRTDDAYADAVRVALSRGLNLVDTSLNYRDQRSERAVGRAMRRFLRRDGGSRDEIILCSKGGFLVRGAIPDHGLDPDEVAGGLHCLAPGFLDNQIERSRCNLGVRTIDIYYLHNPETQLRFVDPATLAARLRTAFATLERAADDGRIRFYGIATWDGILGGALSLTSLVETARRVAGDGHRFRFVQMPVSMAMQEAVVAGPHGDAPVLRTAGALGLAVVASASLWHGRLSDGLPERIAARFGGLETDAQRAVQFARSCPGVTTALVGMSSAAHVEENAEVATVPPLTDAEHRSIRAML